MDQERSSNSSFEDLSNLNESEDKQPLLSENTKSNVESKTNLNTGEDEKKKEPEILDIIGNGQLTKRIIKESENEYQPHRGDYVKINYTGKLENGTIVEEAKDFYLHVGDFEVVQGLDMTIPLMKIGEVAEVTIDSRFAYGNIGLKGESNEILIPPNTKIIYEVTVLEAKVEDFEDFRPYEIRKKYGNQKRERANFWYNRNEFNIAIQLYRRALEYLDNRDGDPDTETKDIEFSNSELQTLLDDRLIVYNNMAMAQIKISAYDAALNSVEHVLRCQPNNSKALYRKGRVLEAKGEIQQAIALLQKAATFEPDSKTIQQDLAKLFIKARREEHNEKELYQKMLGQAKKLEQRVKPTTPKSQANDVPKLKLLGYIMGSILIGVAGVAMYRYKY